jgi:hypothetical protein
MYVGLCGLYQRRFAGYLDRLRDLPDLELEVHHRLSAHRQMDPAAHFRLETCLGSGNAESAKTQLRRRIAPDGV